MFPHELNDPRAFEIAQAMLDGFDKHYRLFREASATAKQRFERADWHGQQRAQAVEGVLLEAVQPRIHARVRPGASRACDARPRQRGRCRRGR